MKSVMNHSFSQVPKADIPRSTFDRSHGYKTTFDAGLILPIFNDMALPGDTHMLKLTAFARLATPIVPIMDNLHMDFFFFSVPLRLIWDNFQKFMGEQEDPGDSIAFLIPTMDINGQSDSSLSDYLGLPINTTTPCVVNSLWHRAYSLIYNEWFRDENLIDSVTVNKNDGPDAVGAYPLRRRGKRHDYFTSALPFPQKGDSVSIPLGTSAPIEGIGAENQVYTTSAQTVYETGGSASTSYPDWKNMAFDGVNDRLYAREDPNNAGFPGIFANLNTATAATVNELRQAFQIQKLLERDARGGTRYTEKIKAHFGVTSPDSRLQRPEFLGGGHIPITINPVSQTSSTDATTPQGNQSGYGVAAGSGIGFTASFTEHCILLGLVSVRADLTYQQGIEKQFLYQTQYDLYWPVFAHLGEQAIENQELWFDDAVAANNTLTFGFQERYAEYRYKSSKITGKFQSDAAASLDVWHLSEDFTALPVLNNAFINDNPPIDRIIATPSEPHFLYDSYINLKSVRPMPIYGVPGFIDKL